MTDIQSLIRARVDAFVSDLTGLIRQAALEQVQGALGGVEVSTGRRGRKAAGAPSLKKRAKGAKRSAADFEAISKAILKSVGGTPGIRADQIAAELGVETRELGLPIKKLLAEKLLSKKGQKRATSYSLKTVK